MEDTKGTEGLETARKPKRDIRPDDLAITVIPAAAEDADKEPVESTFDFFGLPRELRDRIYEDALTWKHKITSQHGARLRARHVTETNLLLVNKQFSKEYLERAERKTTLVITDRSTFHGETVKLPSPMKACRNLELYIALCCEEPYAEHLSKPCTLVNEIGMHRMWIEDLVKQMEKLQSIKIEVILDPHKWVAGCERFLLQEQHQLSSFGGLLKGFDVYHCDFYVKEGEWNFSRQRKLAMKWEPDNARLEPVEMEGKDEKTDGDSDEELTVEGEDAAGEVAGDDVAEAI